jgi:hypothetical protein
MSNTIQNAIKQDPKTDLGYALYNLYSYVKAIESKQFGSVGPYIEATRFRDMFGYAAHDSIF